MRKNDKYYILFRHEQQARNSALDHTDVGLARDRLAGVVPFGRPFELGSRLGVFLLERYHPNIKLFPVGEAPARYAS